MPPKYTHWKLKANDKYAACGVPNSISGTTERHQATCPKCCRLVEKSDRLAALPQKYYESIIDCLVSTTSTTLSTSSLNTSNVKLPTWEELPQEYRQRFEKEVIEGVERLIKL